MNLLLVEDDPQLSRDIQAYLIDAGHRCEHLNRGDWACDYLVDNPAGFDAAILDLGLPECSGIEVLKYWRRAGLTLPVLILTARNSWQERVEGLNAGADDYVGKPFQREELLARLDALHRRIRQQGRTMLEVNGIQLDTEARSVTSAAGENVSLTEIEFSLLQLLMQQAGKIVSKQQLLDAAYDWQEEKSDNLIEVYIRRLRKKLGNQVIRTHRGQGYRMETD